MCGHRGQEPWGLAHRSAYCTCPCIFGIFPRFSYLDLHLCKGQDRANPRPSLPLLAIGYMEFLPGAGFCLTVNVALRRSGRGSVLCSISRLFFFCVYSASAKISSWLLSLMAQRRSRLETRFPWKQNLDHQVCVTLICKMGGVVSPCEDERDDVHGAWSRDPGSKKVVTVACANTASPILSHLTLTTPGRDNRFSSV